MSLYEDDDVVVRVFLHPCGSVTALMFKGFAMLHEVDAERDYPSEEELPEWMRRKLAVLKMCHYKPPTDIVEGVGRRINFDTFWLEWEGPLP